jgi:hypothetical protein
MVGCIDKCIDKVLNTGIGAKRSNSKKRKIQMLTCTTCQATVEILAHQIRGRNEVAVCLDCANRWYQHQLTARLIEAEKVGA